MSDDKTDWPEFDIGEIDFSVLDSDVCPSEDYSSGDNPFGVLESKEANTKATADDLAAKYTVNGRLDFDALLSDGVSLDDLALLIEQTYDEIGGDLSSDDLDDFRSDDIFRDIPFSSGDSETTPDPFDALDERDVFFDDSGITPEPVVPSVLAVSTLKVPTPVDPAVYARRYDPCFNDSSVSHFLANNGHPSNVNRYSKFFSTGRTSSGILIDSIDMEALSFTGVPYFIANGFVFYNNHACEDMDDNIRQGGRCNCGEELAILDFVDISALNKVSLYPEEFVAQLNDRTAAFLFNIRGKGLTMEYNLLSKKVERMLSPHRYRNETSDKSLRPFIGKYLVDNNRIIVFDNFQLIYYT